MSDISTLLPTTELEAVNAMLDSIGEAPIDSLTNIEAPDAGTALRRLRVVSKAVQTIGWEWNTEGVVLTPDSNGNLVLPANTLKFVPCNDDPSVKLTMRGNRVYDRKNQTYVFTKTVKATIVTALDFEELPEAARQYVMLTAAEKFQEGILGSPTLDKFDRSSAGEALQTLLAAEAEVGAYNVLTDNMDALDFFWARTGW